jgi:hypothetical protein
MHSQNRMALFFDSHSSMLHKFINFSKVEKESLFSQKGNEFLFKVLKLMIIQSFSYLSN